MDNFRITIRISFHERIICTDWCLFESKVPRSVGTWLGISQLYCEALALSDSSDICDVINDESMRISSIRTSAHGQHHHHV